MPQIGPYTLYSIEAGRFGLDGGAMFGIVPRSLWSKRISPDEKNRIPLHTRCLLLESADRRILVDVGIGDVFAGTKYETIYAVDHETWSLESSLEERGFSRSDITDVILTHLHFDHCGASTRAGSGGREVRFPNATYYVQRDHWAWAIDPNPKERNSFLERAFRPLEAAGHLELVEGAEFLFPCISVDLVHGHTESQQIVTVADDETTLVYVADLLPTRHHLAAAWTMAYDIRPLQTIEEKTAFLRRAANEEWNLFFEHDPDVAVGNVKDVDRGLEVVHPRSLREL